MKGHIHLRKSQFGEAERPLCEFNTLKASSFLFGSGVHAVRIANPRGHIIVLPYQGQQIWDAVFAGRRLTMSTFFPQPVSSPHLLESYGAFLYHCGALRMGTPGP